MPVRDEGTFEEILDAVVNRLLSEMPNHCRKSNTYIALNPDSFNPNSGELTFIVAPLGGTFDQDYMEGGGENQVTTDGGFLVKIHSPLQLDEPQRDSSFLTDKSKGVLRLVRQVLKTLTNWSPQNAVHVLSRDPVFPSGYSFSRTERSTGSVEIEFKLKFDWEL